MNTIDKVILEWSYRCKKGYPDLDNEQDMALFESLFGFRLDEGLLKWNDFSDATRKYYRLTLIADKIKNKSPFVMKNGDEEILNYTDPDYANLFADQKVDDLKKIGGNRINQFPFFIDGKGNKIGFNAIEKTKEFGGSGGSKIATTERQEHGLIDAINSVPGVKTIVGKNGVAVKGIIKAEKVEGLNELGTEPYADVKFITSHGALLVSAKGAQAPTLAGGGITGISALVNAGNTDVEAWIKSFYAKAYKYYSKIVKANDLEGENLAGNKLVPDVSTKIPDDIIETIVKGTPEMGGPIAYYYQGSMDVEFEVKDNEVHLNGNLVPIEEFIKQKAGHFYAHIRKRDGDFFFTDSQQDVNGLVLPRIFTKKEGSNSTQSRFGTLDKIRGVEI